MYIYIYGRRAAHHWSLPEVFRFLPRWCQTSRKWWKPSTARCPPSMTWLRLLKRRTTPHLWSATGWLLSYLYIYMEIEWSNFTTTEITTYNCVFLWCIYICIYINLWQIGGWTNTLTFAWHLGSYTSACVYIWGWWMIYAELLGSWRNSSESLPSTWRRLKWTISTRLLRAPSCMRFLPSLDMHVYSQFCFHVLCQLYRFCITQDFFRWV